MTFVLMVGVVFGLIACKKDTIAPPTVKVFEGAIILNYTNANVSAEVTDQGGAEVKSRGFIYGVSGGSLDTVFCGGGTGVYSAELSNLQPNTTYVYEAFARNAGGIGASGKVNFTTRELELPTVKTSVVENVGISTASCGGNVINNGGTDVTERGVCWSTNHTPTMNENHVAAGSGLGEYNCNMSNLSANTTYYVRAYAKNSKGIAYGEEKSFTTLDYTLPEVTTANVTEITQTTAKGGGEVTSDGGKVVTERGICWSSNHNPTVDNHKIPSGEGIGGFTANISGLNAHTKYYVRAYAINSKGAAYGNEVSFTTSATQPTVSTGSVTNITNASATGNGNVTDDGGDAVTERGICWSTSHNPTISGNHNNSGTGAGEFSVSITGLSANTTYYIKAYAINSQGTAYGDEVNFKTDDIGKPTVTTNNVTNITQTTATCGGNVTADGGSTVTARGVCWSTSQNPTVNGNHTSNGTGTGSFTSSITGLSPNTTYYVRAYATNSAGTAYGTQRTFTTLSQIYVPTVTTNSVTNITQTTATCGGNVVNNGGATVTARGVCWSTSSNPTINNSHTSNGTGTGSFTSNITGLTAGTTYYVRAYATNSAGTGYGETRTFTTTAPKYAYAGPSSGYVKYPINNPNNVTTLNPDLYLLGGDYYNGYLYAYGYTDPNDTYYFYKINATTGSIVSSHYVGADVFCSDCAYDYTTNRLYGSKGNNLYTINLNTGAQTYVGSFGIEGNILALFCSSSGQLYGVGGTIQNYGKFYRINKSTGTSTLVATLSYYVNYAQSGGFDRDTGTLYWAGYVSDTRSSGVEPSSGLATGNSRYEWYGIIATINPNTGSVTVLQTGTGEQCAWSIR